MSMEDNENKEMHPHRGEYQATVKESTDLLKKLAEFNSKKEDILKKISSIGERIEQRLAPLGKSTGDSMSNESTFPNEPGMFDFPKPPANIPDPFAKIAYTRTRETQKPIFAKGCFNVSFPSKQAITSEWISLATMGADQTFEVKEDGIHLPSENSMAIPTGIRVALPDDLAFHVTSNQDLSVISPTLFTSHQKEMELTILVKNISNKETILLFSIPLFTCYPIHLANNVHCDELLNNTYEDWVHGTING